MVAKAVDLAALADRLFRHIRNGVRLGLAIGDGVIRIAVEQTIQLLRVKAQKRQVELASCNSLISKGSRS
jgi:hypothetical protein